MISNKYVEKLEMIDKFIEMLNSKIEKKLKAKKKKVYNSSILVITIYYWFS